MRFAARSLGDDRLGLAKLLETFANDQWLPAHCTAEQAKAIVLDQFKRRIAHDLELIELTNEQNSSA